VVLRFGIIGITNYFGEAEARNECLAWLSAANPGCTVVGYGPEEEMESLSPMGFRQLTPLTVWLVHDGS